MRLIVHENSPLCCQCLAFSSLPVILLSPRQKPATPQVTHPSSLLDLAHDCLGPPYDAYLRRPRLDGIQHAPLEIIPRLQDGLDPRDVQVPIGRLEGGKLVRHGILVAGQQAEEGLRNPPRLLDRVADVWVGQVAKVLKGGGDVVEELVAEGVCAAKLGAPVAHGEQVADQQLVGKDLDEDVDEGVVQDLAVVADILLKSNHHLLHGRVGVPLGREEVGHDGAEVDGEDEVHKLGNAPGREVDVRVAQSVELRLAALEILRRDVGLEVCPEGREVAQARLLVVVVDAGDLVVGRGDEPVLKGLEALQFGDLAGLVARRLILEHALPRLLAGAQAEEHGVDDALYHVGALRVGARINLLAEHAPESDEVLVLLREADDFEVVGRCGFRIFDHADEEVVHELVVYLGVRFANLPLLGHEGRHADPHGVEVVEVPLHNPLELRGVV
ncbi:hypothetical protein VCV18_007092 [Metarhizium anisopliae]